MKNFPPFVRSGASSDPGSLARLGRVAALGLLALALGGCTGMYLGVQGDRSTSSGALDEDVTARVDIHTITPQAVYEQRQERAAAQALEAARRQSGAAAGPSGAAVGTSDAGYVYRVAPQDILNITVWNHPELNNPAGQLSTELSGRLVGADGTFYYPYAGTMQAAGRTVASIRRELANRLTTYLTEPQVDVSVLKYRGRKAYAVGQFKQPGPQPITDVPLHVTDLVTQAGGLSDTADLREAVLTHNGLTRPIDLDALYRRGDQSQNVLLRDGDTLDVPEIRYNKIFVLGEVERPQSLPLPYGDYTLSEALSDAAD